MKKKMSKKLLLYIIGWIIVVSVIATGIVYSFFHDLNSISDKTAGIFAIIAGVGCLMTFPKSLDDFRSAKGSRIVETKGCLLSFFGVLLILAGLWKLLK